MTKWFEDSLAFYGAYHNEEINKFIHIVCVWPILYTALLFLHYAPTPSILANVIPDYTVNWSTVVAVFYALYYFVVEQPGIAGPLASALVVNGYFLTQNIVAKYPDAWKISIIIHIGCWAAQIYGHQVHEKRAPAFLDNLLQAIVMAPLFVLLEVLFIFGYRRDLQERVLKISYQNIDEFQASQRKGKKNK